MATWKALLVAGFGRRNLRNTSPHSHLAISDRTLWFCITLRSQGYRNGIRTWVKSECATWKLITGMSKIGRLVRIFL